ncbi:metalloprotease, partial [Coprinopsis marcescibilis]
RACGTYINPDDAKKEEQKFRRMRKGHRAPDDLLTFPLWYHVVAKNETFEGGWLADETIDELVGNLNRDFADSGITFDLLGVNRVLNMTWFERADPFSGSGLEAEMKAATRVGGRETLNVWTLALPEGPAGYAVFPWSYDQSELNAKLDGVVMKWDITPGPGKTIRVGKTLTHEVGHWAGLYHTFQGSSCEGSGDFVDDTPTQLNSTSPSQGCSRIDTCPTAPGDDPIFNFMDYSSDECRTQFTPGQIERMRDVLVNYRFFED